MINKIAFGGVAVFIAAISSIGLHAYAREGGSTATTQASTIERSTLSTSIESNLHEQSNVNDTDDANDFSTVVGAAAVSENTIDVSEYDINDDASGDDFSTDDISDDDGGDVLDSGRDGGGHADDRGDRGSND